VKDVKDPSSALAFFVICRARTLEIAAQTRYIFFEILKKEKVVPLRPCMTIFNKE